MSSAKWSRVLVLVAGLALAGCFDKATQLVLFPHSSFITVVDADLRSGQDDESTVIAHIPKGTTVVPMGQMGSHCNNCWLVNTPEGIGWMFTRYLAQPPFAVAGE